VLAVGLLSCANLFILLQKIVRGMIQWSSFKENSAERKMEFKDEKGGYSLGGFDSLFCKIAASVRI
jgi:hypothetical protein